MLLPVEMVHVYQCLHSELHLHTAHKIQNNDVKMFVKPFIPLSLHIFLASLLASLVGGITFKEKMQGIKEIAMYT